MEMLSGNQEPRDPPLSSYVCYVLQCGVWRHRPPQEIGTSLAQYVAEIAISDGVISAHRIMMMNEEEPRTITHHE